MQNQNNNTFSCGFLFICLLASSLLSISIPGVEISTAMAETENDTRNGRDIYNFYCYQCHGYAGNANTLASTYLDPPPANFTKAKRITLTRDSMLKTIRHGRPGTAMVSFDSVLNDREIENVVDYIRENLMTGNSSQLRYHTSENGWPHHDRYAAAFPFVTGEIPLETPWEELDKQQYAGKLLYINACISCHDHGKPGKSPPTWDIRAVSYPRDHYSHKVDNIDAISGASVHRLHEKPPPVGNLSEQEMRGRRLYLDNCAFCHAPDGTAKNWIGSFLDPSPRNFAAGDFISSLSTDELVKTILEGVPGTSMPAWKHVLSTAQVEDIAMFLKYAFGTGKESPEKTRAGMQD